jgi:hypothetical protein
MADFEAHRGRIETDLAALHEHLARELRKDRRSRWLTGIVGVVITAIVFVYMWWVHGQVRDNLTPRNLAATVEGYTRQILPGLGQELSRSLKAAAPDVAKELRTTFTNDVLPQLRQVGEDELVGLASDAIAVAEEQLVETVRTVVREHQAEIRAHALSETAIGPNPLAQALEKALATELTRRTTEQPGESLYAQLEQSRRQLRAINEKLRTLASKKQLTRVESLEKRLITSWMVLVDDKVRKTDGPPGVP